MRLSMSTCCDAFSVVVDERFNGRSSVDPLPEAEEAAGDFALSLSTRLDGLVPDPMNSRLITALSCSGLDARERSTGCSSCSGSAGSLNFSLHRSAATLSSDWSGSSRSSSESRSGSSLAPVVGSASATEPSPLLAPSPAALPLLLLPLLRQPPSAFSITRFMVSMSSTGGPPIELFLGTAVATEHAKLADDVGTGAGAAAVDANDDEDEENEEASVENAAAAGKHGAAGAAVELDDCWAVDTPAPLPADVDVFALGKLVGVLPAKLRRNTQTPLVQGIKTKRKLH